MEPRKPSFAEPVTELRRVKIVECGEPMVDFLAECPDLRLDPPRFQYHRETKLRATVAERLCTANAWLMKRGLRIQVVEGWRPPYIQKRMYAWSRSRFQKLHPEWSETKLVRTVNQFTAPMNARVPPPHTTGGAVDVALTDMDGNPLEMMAPFDKRDPKGFPTHAAGLSDAAVRNRALLAEAMLHGGITNYPSEYWHWSYGDQGWAYRGGESHAIYGPVTPERWTPHPDDANDEPLVWVME